MHIMILITALVGAHAVCDGQHADITLNCNSACQYTAQQSSSGCGVLWQDPCYQCCWTTCLSYTIEGGMCGTDHGTQDYEDCALGGSCLNGHCPIAPSGGDGDPGGLGAGSIAGISVGAVVSVGLLIVMLNCVCKGGRSHAEQLTELMPPAIK